MLLALSLPISFERPAWLWLLAAIPVIVVVSTRTLSGLDRQRRVLAILFRCLVVALLAIALARVEYVKRNLNVAVMFVLDKSRSIPGDLRLNAQDYIRRVARNARGEDRVGIVGFDGRADLDLIPSRVPVEELDFAMTQQPDRTSIASGIRLAMAAFPEGYARRMVILTDGNENMGDVDREIEAAVAGGVAVDVVPIEYHHATEMLIDRITAPARAEPDTDVQVRVIVKSRRPGKARLTLYRNGTPVPLADPIIELSGGMRPNPNTYPIRVGNEPFYRFDAHLTPVPEDTDSIAENNIATAFTNVQAEGKTLLLTQANSTEEQELIDALRREQIELDVRGTNQLSIDPEQLQPYRVVILSNIPADEFNEEQHEALASYVRDFAGGLILIGGDQAFGAGGWIGKPVEEISPVAFDVRHKKFLPAGALAIIMHSCEFPKANFWGEQVAIAAVNTISSQDYLGVICYNPMMNGPNWDVPLARATDKPAIIRKIKQMQIGDMPDFGRTMEIARRDLMAKKDASQRHMIIISDGDPTPPSQATLKQMAADKITCSTVMIGYGVHVMEQTMRDIAAKTGGTPYPVKNPQRLPQIFVKEAKIVKRALLSEEDFTPVHVPPSAGILDSIPEVPPLGGMVLTTPKAEIFMPLVREAKDGTLDPVFALWNYQMGKVAVFTSGRWERDWGSDWAAWEGFDKFWSQTVQWAARQPGSANFDIVTRLEGTQGKISVTALNKDASYLNFLQIGGRLVTPDMKSKDIRLTQTGPGQYEATFDARDNGNYRLSLHYQGQEDEGLIRAGLSVPYSPEFRQLEANRTLIDRIVERTGGRVLSTEGTAEEAFDRSNLQPSVSRQPVWKWVVAWLLLPMFLLDVAARRLASALALSIYVELAVLVVMVGLMVTVEATWWGYLSALLLAEAIGWSIRYRYIVPTLSFFTSSVTALSRAGQRSAESLSQLKDVREKVRGDLSGEEEREQKTQDYTAPLESTADAKRRFDVGDEEAAKPAGDLTSELGGADVIDETGKGTPKRKGDEKQDEPGETTSRLLRAKRRARDQMRDQDDKDVKE